MSIESYLEHADRGEFQWECIETTDGIGMGGVMVEATGLKGRGATITREDANQFFIEVDLKHEPYSKCDYRSSRKYARILAERWIKQDILIDVMSERLEKANQLIILIATTDRKFFESRGYIGLFMINEDNELTYIDEYTRKRVNIEKESIEWKDFNHGGTLKRFIFSLGQWIRGEKEYFLNMYSTSWGYTLKGMSQIVEKARELGMIPEGEETFEEYYRKLEHKGYVTE